MTMQFVLDVLFWLWIVGAAFMLGYCLTAMASQSNTGKEIMYMGSGQLNGLTNFLTNLVAVIFIPLLWPVVLFLHVVCK